MNIGLEDDEFPLLTDWTRAWHVLDIWREALKACGADYRLLTSEAWREDRHLYRSKRRLIETDGIGDGGIGDIHTEDEFDISDDDSDAYSESYDNSDSQDDASIMDIDFDETNSGGMANGKETSIEQDGVIHVAPNDNTELFIFFSHPASSLLF